MDDDDRRQSSKYSSSTLVDENQSSYHRQRTTSSDRPSFGRVGELKNTFETTTRTTYSKDDNTKNYEISIRPGLTEERRRVFEDREQTNTSWEQQPVRFKKSISHFCLGRINLSI